MTATSARWATHPAHDLLPTGDPNPIFAALKAELARVTLADSLDADADDPCLTWRQRGSLRREARRIRGGVA